MPMGQRLLILKNQEPGSIEIKNIIAPLKRTLHYQQPKTETLSHTCAAKQKRLTFILINMPQEISLGALIDYIAKLEERIVKLEALTSILLEK